MLIESELHKKKNVRGYMSAHHLPTDLVSGSCDYKIGWSEYPVQWLGVALIGTGILRNLIEN